MKNLLLTGSPGCGKSTVIADALRCEGLLKHCAGYRTARIFAADGRLRGFAHYPAQEDIPVNIETDGQVSSMFLDFSKVPPLQKDVFTGYTLGLLLSRQETRLILMDEMGGNELNIPEVRSAFLDALKGKLPVIGVLKEPGHAGCFSPEAYADFRREIEETTDTVIYSMEGGLREETEEYVKEWLRQEVPGRSVKGNPVSSNAEN